MWWSLKCLSRSAVRGCPAYTQWRCAGCLEGGVQRWNWVDWFFRQVLVDLLGTGQRRRRGAGAETATETETGTGTETRTESEIETEKESEIEIISGDTGPALGHIPGPRRGLRGSLDTGPGAEVRVPSKIGRIGKSMGRGIWTDGGISMWTVLPLKSLPLGTFTMAKWPASCSLVALCSWRA